MSKGKPGPRLGFSSKHAKEKLKKETLKGHYEWCKKEGRDTSWYERER